MLLTSHCLLSKVVASVSYDDTVKIWMADDDDWVCTDTLTGHTSTIWGAAFNDTGDTLVSCSDDLSLIFWRRKAAGQYEQVASLSGQHERTIYHVDWSHAGQLIATAAGDDYIRIFEQSEDAEDGSPVFTLSAEQAAAHTLDVNCVKWHPSLPDILCSAGDDGLAKVWKVVRET